MKTLTLAAALAAFSFVVPALAEGRQTLGYGTVFTNDLIGDGADRWRTGAFTLSFVRGQEWTGALPETPGELLEFRFRNEILAPENLQAPLASDRPYAGILSFGVHTQFERAGFETSLGLDLVATGPMTGVQDFQHSFHSLIDKDFPPLANEIGNGIHPTVTAEVGRTVSFGGSAYLRPYAEVQAGAEDLVRVGGDVVVGQFGRGELLVREPTGGFRFDALGTDQNKGMSLVLGADMAKVFDSIYLPESQGYVLTDIRSRARAGLVYRTEKVSVFYGLSWLGKEFEAQNHEQVVGTLHLNLKF